MFTTPNPLCDLDCKFSEIGPTTTTAMYFAPVYDKHGNNINPDGNISSGSIICSTCGKQWIFTFQFGKTDFKEVKN